MYRRKSVNWAISRVISSNAGSYNKLIRELFCEMISSTGSLSDVEMYIAGKLAEGSSRELEDGLLALDVSP